LYIIDSLKMGGKERQLIELLKGLIDKKQIKVKLVIMNKDVHYPEVYDLDIDINYLIRSSKRDIRIFFELYYLCKTFKPDIIHTWDSMTSFYALPIAKCFKIKVINGSIRNATPIKTFSFDWFSKLTFPYYDKIISNSLAGLKQYNISRKNGHCIHNGFDFNRITKLKPINEIKENLGINQKKVIGMVASFTKKKDWSSFFEIARIILSKRDDIAFIAVGSGKVNKKIISSINLELKEKIHFFFDYHPVEEIINVFDIGVLTTDTNYHQEGISNSIIEYMALSKSVIATNCGGNNELIIDGKTGFLVDNNNHEQICNLILDIVNDYASSVALGLAGKKRIAQSFSLDNMLNKYYYLYNNILS